MRKFNVNKLPELSKIMFEVQQKWIEKNAKESLQHHHKKIETLLKKTQTFSLWKSLLLGKHKLMSKEMVPELFMDAYLSVAFSSVGLYKQANVCLRAQLETALRLVFFSTHGVEYEWWEKGSEWYLASQLKDVWGKEYQYFRELDEVKSFNKKSNLNLFDLLKEFYRRLSKYVHGGAISFQTTSTRISPKYNVEEFNRWATNFNDVQKFSNTILMLGFSNIIKETSRDNQRKLLKSIGEKKFIDTTKKTLGLRIRGRI